MPRPAELVAGFVPMLDVRNEKVMWVDGRAGHWSLAAGPAC